MEQSLFLLFCKFIKVPHFGHLTCGILSLKIYCLFYLKKFSVKETFAKSIQYLKAGTLVTKYTSLRWEIGITRGSGTIPAKALPT
jgi:hypothetical protein